MTRNRIIVGLAVLLAAVGVNAFAFHSGGVAECEGCHSMHEATSLDGNLLIAGDASSTCINPSCHGNTTDTAPSSYHVATLDAAYPTKMPVQMTPGGDFGWLKVDFTWTASGTNYTEFGYTRGHSIVAVDAGFAADTRRPTGPGGDFDASVLGCQSCHDPHGKGRQLYNNGAGGYGATGSGEPIYTSGSYGSVPKANTYGGGGQENQGAPTGLAVGIYRLLWAPASPNPPAGANYTSYPIAVSPSSYNRIEDVDQTRVAYGGAGSANDWGTWCGACHGEFNVAGGDDEHHPTGEALGTGPLGASTGSEATNYNAYVSSGRLNGDPARAYNTLVPFAEATSSISVLASHAQINDSYLNGPGTGAEVMCLSCHRAHASGFMEDLRWDYGYEFMTKGGQYIGSDNPLIGTTGRGPLQSRGRTNAWWQQAYYGRAAATHFGPYDRVLCNKCHAQD